MNFDQAIAAHGAWKQKLSEYLIKRDGSLKFLDISSDNKCPLGQWIHGEGSKYSKLAEYSVLKSEHARFHKAAAEVVRKADSGESVPPGDSFRRKKRIRAASTAVVIAIMRMKTHAAH